jgi:RNA polymerase sigma factor (sigma-70 family)
MTLMAAHPERVVQHLRTLVPAPAAEQASEADLLNRFIGGDEDAFAALVARHGPMVLAVCRRTLHDSSAAEDVAQATFLVLARQARSIRRPETLAAWLHRTARHLALKYRRAEVRRRQREARSVLAAPRHASPGPLEELTVRELLVIFDEEVHQLPERNRLPLILCCLEGCTQEEVARRLGWTAGSVKGRLERGRAMLHDRLARRGLDLCAVLVGVTACPMRLPADFIARTLHTAALFTSPGDAVAAGLSREVAALAETGLGSTTMFRTKLILALLLLVGAVAAGLAAAYQGQAPRPPAEKQKAQKRAAARQPEKRARTDRHGDPLPDGAVARLGTVRWRAVGEVEALVLSADGKTVATDSTHGICLFDADGRLTRRLHPTGTVYPRLAFSPGGKRLACRYAPHQGPNAGRQMVQIWDLPAGRKTGEYKAEGVLWLGWSGGEPLAVLLGKGAILFRQLGAGKEQRFESKDMPAPHMAPYTACACVPARKRLAVASVGQRCVIHIWDLATGKKLDTLKPKIDYVLSLALSPDGRTLASVTRSGDHHTAQLWDVATGKAREVLDAPRYPRAVAFSPDGKTLASVGWSEVRFHDVTTGRERSRTRSPASFAATSFSPDSKTLIAAEKYSGAIRHWNVADGTLKSAPAGHTNRPNRISFAPDGARVATSGDMDGSIIVWEPATGKPLGQFRPGSWVRSCAFSADGRVVYSCTTGDRVDFSDAASGRVLHTLKMEDPDQPDTRQSGLDMRLSDDGKTLVAVSAYYQKKGGGSQDDLLLTGWDAASRKQLFRRRHGRISFWPALSPDLKRLAFAAGGDRRKGEAGGWEPIQVEDLVTGKAVVRLPEGKGQSWPVGFSPDGRLLAVTTSEPATGAKAAERAYTLRLWEVDSAGEVLALPGEPNVRVAFSSDRRLLALGGHEGGILLWDLRAGKAVRRFKGFDAGVTSLAFSPDGRLLVSGLSDTSLLVWAVPSAKGDSAILDRAATARAWADLGRDARTAFAARGKMAGSPEQAVALCKERLAPVRAADPALLRRLLADLDSDDYKTREKARKGLEKTGDRATAALAEALTKKPSLETYRRIQALLRRLGRPVARPETLRSLRAVAVLEDIGTPAARKVIETLAKGLPEALLTREAKETLRRLSCREAARKK